MRRRLFPLLVAWVAGLMSMSSLQAHDPGLSTAEVKLLPGTIELTAGFALSDAEQLLPGEARAGLDGKATDFARLQPQFSQLAPELWELRVGDEVLRPETFTVQLAEGDNLSFRTVYRRSEGGAATLRAVQLQRLPFGHRQFITAQTAAGATLAQKLLSAKDDRIELTLPAAGATSGEVSPAPSIRPSFWGFLKLGIEHIWTGYDHLLFLLALLIVCRTFRSIVGIISCFTLAHSLTLALATLNVVNLPARLVEPAIALSIVYVGVENLVRRGAAPSSRYVLTFVFGLIHGFGFASVLRELGVGSDGAGLGLPLFTFNLGVEIGQIVIAAIVLPVVWQLRKRPAFVSRGIPALSACVAVAGVWWLVERTLL